MKLLVVSGSARQGSFNTRLAHLVGQLRPADTVGVLSDLDELPFFNQDVEAIGTPPAVSALRSAVADADAVVVVTPEYNGAVPGLLGNAVDWLSRPAGRSVLREKPVLVLSASPTRFGGVRAADHLRTVLGRIGATVAPTGLSVAVAHERLGERTDPALSTELSAVLADALDQAPETADAGLAAAS